MDSIPPDIFSSGTPEYPTPTSTTLRIEPPTSASVLAERACGITSPLSDKPVRDAGVRHIKEWVEVTARLGAPVIRVFAGTQIRSQTWQTVAKGYTRDQVQEWIASALGECADHGKKYGVRIGVQNHGDFLQTGLELLGLVKAVGSDWCGPIVD